MSDHEHDLGMQEGDGDGIVSDGYSLQLATMTGSVQDGFVATLKVPI